MEPFYVEPHVYASKGKRFLNFIIDLAARVLILGLIFIIMDAGDMAIGDNDRLGNILIDAIITVIYYSLFEGLTGGLTLGKMITGTKVVTLEGEIPDFGIALKRSFCRLIPFNAISGLIGNQFFHDSIPETIVIDKKKFDLQKAIYDSDMANAPMYPLSGE